MVTGPAGVDDSAITASTEATGHEAVKARLDGVSAVGWKPTTLDNQNLQVQYLIKYVNVNLYLLYPILPELSMT